MSTHTATIAWSLSGTTFAYSEYSRKHNWTLGGGFSVAASAAPEFMGDAACADPEEAFVASIASCHMLTFLAIASRKRIKVLNYCDEAVGWLEKNPDGRLAITRVELHPRIEFAEPAQVTPELLAKMHSQSHRECFIANSVRTTITLC